MKGDPKRSVANITSARTFVCRSYKKVAGFQSGHGIVSKRTILPLPGIEQRSSNKFTDWDIPANGYYKFPIGAATFVGYGLLNYRWVFSAGRFLQSAVASGTSKLNLEDQWLERSISRH